ncbi:MAG: CpsD/CapB family tyrosine-protein kinase [Polyangiales bacterium]
MSDPTNRKRPATQGPPFGDAQRADHGDDLSNYFSDQAPAPAPPHELIDGDAATRVASSAQIFNAEYAQGFPTNPGGWQPVGGNDEAVTLTSDQLRQHMPPGVSPMMDDAEARTQFLPQGAMNGYYDAYGQVVDEGHGGGDYGMVPVGPGMGGGGGYDQASWQPPSYSMLRVNPAEHVGPFSPDLVMMSHPDGQAAAQFRTLRFRLEQEPDLQIIVVASAREGAGKSVTAANLALAMAEGGRIQVLLVDASLRNPALHKLFGIRGELGLTTILAARQNDPSLPIDVIRITASLSFIPCGPPVASAHAALSSEAAAVLLGQLRQEFRYIIVDSAAVFGTAETLAWHGLIDKYVLVARQGMTTTEDLTAACDRLQREKIVGVTFVGVKGKR